MAQLYDEQGNEVEAFTQEEVTAKVEEETKKAIAGVEETSKKEIEDAQKQIKVLADEKKDLEEKLDPKNPKSVNFKKARQALDDKDDQIETLTNKIEELKDGLGKQIEQITGTNKQTEIKNEILSAVGGDKEIAKKVEVAYAKFGGAPATPEELQTRIADAIKLVTDDKGRPLINSSIINASGGGKSPSISGKISDEVADMAKRNMGLSDKELKKANLI